MKYKILKALDVAGLQFLDPIVRLIYGEEPKVQLSKIGRFIVIPILAFIAFLGIWGYVAPKHATKSGEVPTPGVVANAADGIWTFHKRENIKSRDYLLAGDRKETSLTEAQDRLASITKAEKAASSKVAEAQSALSAEIASLQAPHKKELAELKAFNKTASNSRKDSLSELAESVSENSSSEREAYLDALRDHNSLSALEKENEKKISAKIDEIAGMKYQPLIDARFALKLVAEEKQFLQKRVEYLSKNNRSEKVAEYEAKLGEYEATLASSSGKELEKTGARILRQEERIERVSDSSYAQPWTFPRQIKRSLMCVFFGFILASMIAIPIGILCGLSSVFMAAMTPFIALFKPVSPIVWLPIALIVVGGFIPDPDKHWFIDSINSLPIIGSYDLNPAFIASAITVALCSLWPTLVNTALGVASIDKDHINVARVLRLGFWSRLFKIVIPSALPLIFAGLRISLGVGWMVLIAAELLSSSEGIGKFVWDMFNNGSSDSFAQMFVVVFVVGLIGMILDRTMIVFQRLVSFDEAPTSI